MEEGFFSAKLKWVIQICLCVEGEFVIVPRSWFRDTEMLRKATSNQALTKVKCTHIYTFTLAHTNTHTHSMASGPETETRVLSKAPLNC